MELARAAARHLDRALSEALANAIGEPGLCGACGEPAAQALCFGCWASLHCCVCRDELAGCVPEECGDGLLAHPWCVKGR